MTLDDLDAKMIKMYYNGFSVEEIAKKFKVSIVYVQLMIFGGFKPDKYYDYDTFATGI